MIGSLPADAQDGTTTYINSAERFRGPLTYKDERSGTVFYVESDGRHVSAISLTGKILWTRDPYVEGGLEPYRFPNARIVYIGLRKAHRGTYGGDERMALAIVFESTQFGQMNMETGHFDYLGSD